MSASQPSPADLSDIVFTDWVERWLPKSWRPYARLCRLDRPIGTWLTLLPAIAALVQAAGGLPDFKRLIVFSLGALLMRGIGCTVNDMWDRDIDKHVERTRFRPLTSGQLGMRQAVAFLIGQLAVCACLLFFINGYSRWLALAVLPFVFIYPFCKRVTYWPQVVLGICFNWGMLMAWSDTRGVLPLAGVAMWLGAVLWQVGYDSIYAYVDVRDDRRLNLHSTAMRFADRGKAWIGGFYAATLLLWAWAGHRLDAGGFYYLGMIVLAAHFGWQLAVFDLQRPDRNFLLFRANLWVGVILIAG
ncbi:MAG: 4-hydroxybenzoate octaprenyltransferase, partial [Achromobacter mucicolens]